MTEERGREFFSLKRLAPRRKRAARAAAGHYARRLRHLVYIKPDPTQTTPRLLRVWITIPFWLLVTGLVAFGIHTFLRNTPTLVGEDVDELELLRVLLTIMTGIGAVLLGVYAYRKQRLEEGASVRQDEAQFLTRYNAATEQLTHEKPTARLAGVYALARLADDWSHQRQQCVDVLCAYLRMPPEDEETDAEVRATILRVIAEHLRGGGQASSWSDLNYNFDRAQLHDVNLDTATFSGEMVTFQNTQFTGTITAFGEASFTGESVIFDGASFSSQFTSFVGAQFGGQDTSFVETRFDGQSTSFVGATFGGLSTHFDGTTLSSEDTFLNRVTFGAESTSFAGATFNGQSTSFDGASFSGELMVFDGATFSNESTSFTGTTFGGQSTSFYAATFQGCRATFDRAERQPGSLLLGLDHAQLEEGATIMKDGQPFIGWPKVDN